MAQAGGGSKCVGCHNSAPDGLWAGFASSPEAGNGDPAWFGLTSVDGYDTHATISIKTLDAQWLPRFPWVGAGAGEVEELRHAVAMGRIEDVCRRQEVVQHQVRGFQFLVMAGNTVTGDQRTVWRGGRRASGRGVLSDCPQSTNSR